MSEGLVYIGKIIEVNPIENADFICCATVICGKGGKWKGIIRKADFCLGDNCIVYLPDALIPENDDMLFMKESSWRVKMRRFRGAPSEVVIMPLSTMDLSYQIGCDITDILGVTKYIKPVPAHLNGLAKGYFPDFIPKTDELNYQRHPELVEDLHGKSYYITEKADGSSTTAYRYKGEFGVCSRNLELQRNEENGYWKVASRYQLEEFLPEGFAIQWETCGPGIQSNPMGLDKIDGFAFNAYNIEEKRNLTMHELLDLCSDISFPTVKLIQTGQEFDKNSVELLGEGKYKNGKQREGVVVRSQDNLMGYKPISFKVINLGYDN